MKTHKKFDFSEVVEFDKHIAMSIPNYDGLINLVGAFFLEIMPPDGVCVDVGCSSGSLLNSFSEMTVGRYIGIDSVDFGENKNFEFRNEDCVDALQKLKAADFVICLFTLQFLGRHKRAKVITELGRLVSGGATVIIGEKLYMGSAKINGIFHRKHMMKKRELFNDREILDKDEALFGSMYCINEQTASDDYENIGCSTRIWQSYNFAAWIIETGE
tara:strand:- start:66 stop:713 length:648 start_codon:yes stop_codon:yes gene_type:complete